MLPSLVFGAVAIFAAAVLGQTPAQSSTASATSSTAVPTYSIAVGAEGFKFTPNEIKNVSVGSVLVFSFYPGGHTVVRAEFGEPCIPYEYTGANKVGFYSGDISPQVISNNLPKFQITVNDTDPIFYYCSAPGSCYQQHMIGVINPNATETLDLQMQYAENATYQLSPGQPFPSETAATSTSTPTGTATGAANAGNNGSTSGGSSLSAGAIAGIAIGGAAVVIFAALLLYLCGRRGGFNRAYRRSTATFPPSGPMAETGFKYPGVGDPSAKRTTQGTISTASENDPYSSSTRSPSQHHEAYMGTPQGSPPLPLSPGQPSPGYSTYRGTLVPGVHSPGDTHQGYYMAVEATPPHDQASHPPPPPPQPPVELPASADPGHSPLPQYQPSRQFSWAQGSEGSYRPSRKSA